MKRAVCILIHEGNGSGRVLATSRRNDNTQWGFPGGKVDPGESDVQAAVRELKEETGLTVPVSSLVPVYCDETTGFICTTFLVTTSAYDSIVAEKGIEVRYLDVGVLTNPTSSPFAMYNTSVFNQLLGG